jgi:HAD superfamily hydrolase (TIGR01509 family)
VIRAVVFDFDGLILDTEGPVYASWCEAFAAHGCTPPLTLDEWALEIGTVGGLDVLAMLHERAPAAVDEEAMQRIRRAYRDALLAAEVVRPGVVQWLDDARRLGLGVAIASSSEYEWVDAHLRRIGLRERFSHLSCHSVRLAPKPSPDTYVHACGALGVAPAEALAVEDSPNGVAAAKAAGLTCVAVPNAITARLDLRAADIHLDSLAAMSLEDLLVDLDT